MRALPRLVPRVAEGTRLRKGRRVDKRRGGQRLPDAGGRTAGWAPLRKNEPNGLTSKAGRRSWSPIIAMAINVAMSVPKRETGVNGLKKNTTMPSPQMTAVWAIDRPQYR